MPLLHINDRFYQRVCLSPDLNVYHAANMINMNVELECLGFCTGGNGCVAIKIRVFETHLECYLFSYVANGTAVDTGCAHNPNEYTFVDAFDRVSTIHFVWDST